MLFGEEKQKHITEYTLAKSHGRTPTCYCVDLVKQVGILDPVIGRDKEIARALTILTKLDQNNVLLIGDHGVGKTAIVEGIAKRIKRGDVPSFLLDAALVTLHARIMLAQTEHPGRFMEKFQAFLKGVKPKDGGRVILFIDEIHLLMGVGDSGGSTYASNYLKVVLNKGEVQCICTTTPEDFFTCVTKDPTFEKKFQVVKIAEPSIPVARNILRSLKEKFEDLHGVRIEEQALVDAVELSDKFIKGARLPCKAIDLVDEACANIRVQLECLPEEIGNLKKKINELELEVLTLKRKRDVPSKNRLTVAQKELDNSKKILAKHDLKGEQKAGLQKLLLKRKTYLNSKMEAMRLSDWTAIAVLDATVLPQLDKDIGEAESKCGIYHCTVGSNHIAAVVSQRTGIPITKLNGKEDERLTNLSVRLREKVFGQDQAVDTVAAAVRRSKACFCGSGKPKASFLFLGPIGVGKTQLAKVLAEEISDDKNPMLTIDMSNYKEGVSLIEALTSCSGFNLGWKLTEAVKLKPYSLIVFDNVEEAHAPIMNILFHVLSVGHLTDEEGEIVDFSNTMIIMTSRLGADDFMETFMERKTLEEARDAAIQKVRHHFEPELLELLDEIVIFDPLKEDVVREILKSQLKNMDLLGIGKTVDININEDVYKYIISRNWDQAFGARKTAIWAKKYVATKLIDMILGNKVKANSTVTIGVEGEELSFKVEEKGENIEG